MASTAPLSVSTNTFSPSELSYLRTSLTAVPPIRPDSRRPTQFRPLTAETSFLPTTYGSSRLLWPDGAECIAGIKAEPLPLSSWNAVEVSVEVSGQRDDDPLPVSLAQTLNETVATDQLKERLKIGDGSKWRWGLFVDILLLTPPVSHPATLLSLAAYLALKTTKIPRLVSEPDEDPMFDDDWFAAEDLGVAPPITLLAAAVGENVFFDPTREEMVVADCVLGVSVGDGGSILAVRTMETGGSGEGGVSRPILRRVIKEGGDVAKTVFQSLEAVIASQN